MLYRWQAIESGGAVRSFVATPETAAMVMRDAFGGRRVSVIDEEIDDRRQLVAANIWDWDAPRIVGRLVRGPIEATDVVTVYTIEQVPESGHDREIDRRAVTLDEVRDLLAAVAASPTGHTWATTTIACWSNQPGGSTGSVIAGLVEVDGIVMPVGQALTEGRL